jgi:hypothetical protein
LYYFNISIHYSKQIFYVVYDQTSKRSSVVRMFLRSAIIIPKSKIPIISTDKSRGAAGAGGGAV